MLLGGLLLLAAEGQGAVYVYLDTEGTAHFTDAPTTPEFRRVPAFDLPEDANLVRGQYANLINRIAAEEGVDPHLVRAVIRAESNFDPLAISRKGAQGLMQLMPGTAGRYAVPDAFDPEANIRGGVRYLRYLQDLFPGRLPLALAAYNAGEQAVLRYAGVPPFPETRQYVDRVLGFYGRPAQAAGGTSGSRPAGRTQTEAAESPPSTPSVYRSLDADGTPFYTNLPPVIRPPAGVGR
jgi:soluble lytic murein transglycosylase